MDTENSLPYFSKKLWIQIICASLGMLLVNQFIEQILNRQMMISMQNESSSFVITATALFFNGVSIVWFQSVVLMSLIQTLHSETMNVPITTKLGDFSREWLRSMGNASLWMFVLIIPGLIRWVDYSLLPFICFFDPAYQRGEVDALAQCRKIAKGIRVKLWALWVGLGILLPLVFTSLFGDYESFFDYPLAATGLIFIDALIQVLAFWMLWKLYLKARLLS